MVPAYVVNFGGIYTVCLEIEYTVELGVHKSNQTAGRVKYLGTKTTLCCVQRRTIYIAT